VTHAELQAMVCQLAHIMGWRWLHVRRSIGKGHRWATTTNIVGWPDLILWSPRQPGRQLAVELKVPPDKLTDDQAAVLGDLAAAGWECYVVTPDAPKAAAPYRVGLDDVPHLFDRSSITAAPGPATA